MGPLFAGPKQKTQRMRTLLGRKRKEQGHKETTLGCGRGGEGKDGEVVTFFHWDLKYQVVSVKEVGSRGDEGGGGREGACPFLFQSPR